VFNLLQQIRRNSSIAQLGSLGSGGPRTTVARRIGETGAKKVCGILKSWLIAFQAVPL
jgi:hypothetical protein